MVLRVVLGLVGLAELVWPRETVDFWVGLAVSDPGEVDLRPWVYTAARVEGLLILLWVLATLRRE